MASTYSPSLKLTLMGDGDQAGLWGQTTNTNLGTLLEQAITGVTSVVMSDANYTLTSFNGISDEARNAVLVVTGTNNAVRDLIPPVVEKLYTIANNTTGGYAIRVIGASGTGVNIPNGTTCLVYCDGTNFINGLSGSAGNFTVTGALAVTGTSNLGGAITYGGVTLSNAVTGTGSMALSASPTFTGTPAGPTASPGTNTTQIATTAFVQASTTALGLGTMSTQNANNVSITGGTINGVTGNGSGFTNLTAANLTGSRTIPKASMPAGTILQVLQAYKTDIFSASTSTGSFTDIPGLSVSITPTSSSSKILILANIVLNGDIDRTFGAQMVKNGTPVGASNGAYPIFTWARGASYVDVLPQGIPAVYLDSPATTSALTYKIQVANISTGSATFLVNYPRFNPDGAQGTSSITVMEIAQ